MMRVMVLAGGPDRERGVSLKSGARVAAALREAGHEVMERDLGPGDRAALDEFIDWGGDVVFPVFHGRWGEGGEAQRLLDERGLPYVGCRESAARRCFDKAATKAALREAVLPTPDWALVDTDAGAAEFPPSMSLYGGPVVLKPNDDGSSIDLALCRDEATLRAAWAELSKRNPRLLVERLVTGREVTVSVLDLGHGVRALPPICIEPATEFYDYAAKYERDDTQYLFDFASPEAMQALGELSERVFGVLGVRHLCRVDLFLDETERPWVIEVNTLPGFTDHSLLPMAARRAGMEMPTLVDRLVRAALAD